MFENERVVLQMRINIRMVYLDFDQNNIKLECFGKDSTEMRIYPFSGRQKHHNLDFLHEHKSSKTYCLNR